MTITELIELLKTFPGDAPVCVEDDMRGPQEPRAYYWTDYDLDGAATDYGYPSEDAVIIQ